MQRLRIQLALPGYLILVLWMCKTRLCSSRAEPLVWGGRVSVLALCLSFRSAQPPHLRTGRTSWPRLTVRDPSFAVGLAVAVAA